MQRLRALGQSLNPQVDYVGQELCSKVTNSVFMIGCPLSLVVGVASSNFYYFLGTLAAAYVLACALVVPAWPMYRRNPVVFGEKKRK